MYFAVLLKDNLTSSHRVKSVVFGDANTETRLELGSALTDDDRTRLGRLAAVELHAAILRVGVTTVLG